MKKLIKFIWLAIKSLWQLSHLAIAIAVIAVIAYFLGYSYLQGIKGGDSFYHLSNIFWFNKFFPNIPYWYPLQNGGVVPVWGYPHLAYFIVIIIHRFFSLNLINSFQILGFLSVPLTALGLYVFVWLRLKKQTAALIGAALYLLMPLSWVWLFDWGFYTESISYIFIFPTLTFYDIFLKSSLKKDMNFSSRISLLIAVLFLSSMFLTHPNTFFVTLVIAFFLTFFSVMEKGQKILTIVKNILFPVGLFTVLSLFLLSFLLFDFYSYSKENTPFSAISGQKKIEFLENYATPVKSLLGIETIPATDFKIGHKNIVVPPAVWLPAIFGFLTALVLSKKAFALAVLAFFPIVYFYWPILAWYTIKFVPTASFFIHHRSALIFLRLLIPLTAGFGIWSVVKIIISAPLFWIKKGRAFWIKKAFISTTASIFSLTLALFLIYFFANKPETLWKKTDIRYGSGSFDIRDPFKQKANEELGLFEAKKLQNYLSKQENWPQPKIVNGFEKPLTRFSDFINEHKDEKMLRIDVSPYLGGVVQTLGLESEISMINLYAITLSLLDSYWGYEQQVLFSENTGNTINVNNLAKWFGIKYLFLEDELDPINKYANDKENWERVDPAGVWKFKNSTELYSWTVEKPAILVIGSVEKAVFEPVFRTAVSGGFDYADGWLTQGKERVDDYSLNELKNFDTLFLYGYSYKNRSKAYRLLDKYIKEGGNVLISTGWQYTDADWELKKAPEFFPVKDLGWSTEFNTDSKFNLDSFSPLVWDGQAWGVSVPITGKREWGETILSADGKPLAIKGQYGKGKVIWLGLNLLGHINTYDFNKEEVDFFGNLLRWFGSGSFSEELEQTKKLSVLREHPDKVEFTFQEQTASPSILYWRESQINNWKASLVNNKGKKKAVKIYRAGPGFMLMRLPPVNKDSKLILEFKTGLRTLMGRIISIITLVGLLLYVFLAEKIGVRTRKIKNSAIKKFKNKFKTLSEDEKY